jgi:hypothetical protein
VFDVKKKRGTIIVNDARKAQEYDPATVNETAAAVDNIGMIGR